MSSLTRIVLVTGASRGIGADVARQLGAVDTHVVVNYREQAKQAAAVADSIRDAGGQATTMAADVSDEHATIALMDDVAARFGKLDAVVLNASGGARDAQRRLARLALPMMSAGGRVVFVTSHQAHFHPFKAVPKGYAAVAAAKRADETALLAMRPEFERAGVGFTVVSGDLIDGRLPEFSAAIAHATTAAHPSGIVYVGAADYLMTAA